MDKKAKQTPFDQKLFLIFVVTFASMTAFEFISQFLFPYPPDWRSNLITSLFTSGLAVIIAYFPLNSYYETATKLTSEVVRRHDTETELRESEQRLSRTFDQSPIGAAILTPDLRFSSVNSALCSITGYSPDELLSRRVTSIVAKEDAQSVIESANALKSGSSDVDERDLSLLRKNGDKIWVHQSVRLIRDTDGAPLYFIPMFVDIHERKLAGEALEKTNKKLSMLSTVTRHDIKNQLTGSVVFLQLMKSKVGDEPVLIDYLDKLISCNEAIERQIEFTRYYEELGTANAGWFDVRGGILQEAIQLPLEKITLDPGKEGISIYADPLIGKVYYNLMENSLRHGEHVTEISFSAEETENGLVISYNDNGIGISPSEKEKIFIRGYGKNTGIGLFLIREILATTGIGISETGITGKGARFDVLVPKGAYRLSS